MSINIGDKPEMNVVNVGDEISSDQLAAIQNANGASGTNYLVTKLENESDLVSSTRLSIGGSIWTSATSGTGANTSTNFNQRQVTAPTTAAGYATTYYNYIVLPNLQYNSAIDWSKRVVVEFLLAKGVITSDANTVCRLLIGKPSFSGIAGDLTNKGIGIRFAGNGNVELVVHNGTTLTAVSTSISATATFRSVVKLVSDGIGNVTLYSNGVQVATTALGPTSSGNGNAVILEAQNLATISTTQMQVVVGNFTGIFGY